MNIKTIPILSRDKKTIAITEVALEGNRYEGRIDLANTPKSIRDLFAEFEEIVNDQMLSFLDDIQAKIASLGLGAEIDGVAWAITDLQVYPEQGDVSFRVVESQSASGHVNGVTAAPAEHSVGHVSS